MRCPVTILILLAVFLLPPTAVGAHTLESPETVVANPGGTFAFTAIFTAGPGTAVVGGYSWLPVYNVLGGMFADCFCDPGCIYEEGESFEIYVDGALVDLGEPGAVLIEVGLCDGGLLQAETTILPPAVPIARANWGQIKVLYR